MGRNEQQRPVVAAQRRRAIAEQVRAHGSVTVADLEGEFGVSSMTARRDLAELERQGVLRRTHGGAVLPSLTGHEDSFAHRLGLQDAAKRRLAGAAVRLVEDGETVFLDCSTTAYHVAEALLEARVRTTVLTNSVPVMELITTADAPSVELIGVGGALRRLTRSFVGPHAVRTVLDHYADKLFLSAKGVTRDGFLTDPDPLETEVKRTMITRAASPVALLDASKLRTQGMSVIADAGKLALAIVDGAGEDDLAPLRDSGVRIERIGEEDGDEPSPDGRAA
jgi:DeoR/GlpR family transcriptional regulator of sugar metabolism